MLLIGMAFDEDAAVRGVMNSCDLAVVEDICHDCLLDDGSEESRATGNCTCRCSIYASSDVAARLRTELHQKGNHGEIAVFGWDEDYDFLVLLHLLLQLFPSQDAPWYKVIGVR